MLTALSLALTVAPLSAPQVQDRRNPLEFFCSSRRFGYSGTMDVYNTLEDAQAEQNPRATDIAFAQRDGAVYVVRDRPEFWETNFNAVLTHWSPPNSPSNQSHSFFQMYDSNTNNIIRWQAYWSPDKKTFTVETSGKNATYGDPNAPEDYARLWNGGLAPGGGATTKGTYITYKYKFVATGLNGQDPENDGFFVHDGNAGGYTGTFEAIFRNESTTSPQSNGFYRVTITFNNTSWAAQNFRGLETDKFGSNQIGALPRGG